MDSVPPTPSIDFSPQQRGIPVVLCITSDADRPLRPSYYSHFYHTPANDLSALICGINPDPRTPACIQGLSPAARQQYDAAAALVPEPMTLGDIYTSKTTVHLRHLWEANPPPAAIDFDYAPSPAIVYREHRRYILFVVRQGWRAQFHLMDADTPNGRYLVENHYNGVVMNRIDTPVEWVVISQILGDVPDLLSVDDINMPAFNGVLPRHAMFYTLTVSV